MSNPVPPSPAALNVMVITDGRAGNENQCLGISEALGCANPAVQRITLRAPWKQLIPFMRVGLAHAFADETTPRLDPMPDLVLTAGRAAVAASFFVREATRRARKRPLRVHILNPRIDPAHFDLVVTPRHDDLRGANVVLTYGGLHRLTPYKIAEAAAAFHPVIAHLPRPYITVLVGGSTKIWKLTPREMVEITMHLGKLAEITGGSLIITPSRRTGAENIAIMRAGLEGVAHFLWDGTGDNPYFGMIGVADGFVVTADSVNMVTEACSTGKPVYVVPLQGGAKKITRFHQSLQDAGMTRPFEGRFEPWTYVPLDDRHVVTERIRALL